MNLGEQTQELIEIAELCGRHVTLYLRDMNNESGILHSLTSPGVLIKTENGYYEFYPWRYVMCIRHGPKQKEQGTNEKQRLEIVASNKTLLNESIPEDYSWDWEDNAETIALVVNDSEDETIKVNLNTKEIEVCYDKDLELAKKLATKFKINKITRDYGSE